MTATASKNQTTPVLNPAERGQRAAIAAWLRNLLVRQSDSFRSYLAVLDRQNTIISSGSAQDVLAYVDLEETIAAEIFSIQKVIEPMELMYRNAGFESPADDIPSIKISLENLKTQATVQTMRNRNLIAARMNNIRISINEIRNHPVSLNGSIYRTAANAPSLIDVRW